MNREHYSHAIADEHKRKKRIEAEERQEKRNRRTSKEQLVKLDTGGFSAKKERAAHEKQGTKPST